MNIYEVVKYFLTNPEAQFRDQTGSLLRYKPNESKLYWLPEYEEGYEWREYDIRCLLSDAKRNMRYTIVR
jgi:hypothetical protein